MSNEATAIGALYLLPPSLRIAQSYFHYESDRSAHGGLKFPMILIIITASKIQTN
jgi:hypothetical protein